MSNQEYYYAHWLQIKKEIYAALEEDVKIQQIAEAPVGLKPQANAIETVARVYCKYCKIYNTLCDCYDQMQQVQRRPYIKKIIDAVTCRLLEIKITLQEVEAFEFTYPENALQQMLIVPQDIQILCPYFYPFEIRQAEMQYIIDQILAGNRLGDPEPTPSELERREQKRLEKEECLREEKEAEINRKLAMGEDIVESGKSVILTPEEQEEQRSREEYEYQVCVIQRMERSRVIVKQKKLKQNKDENMYLELAGIKKAPARESLRIKASELIQKIYRRFMDIKREHKKDYQLRIKLGMIIPSWSPPSAKLQLKKIKKDRRFFRRKYYENWLEAHVKEKTRILRLRKDDIMEDISAEIRQWFRDWYLEERVFDEFPWPAEGGSILVVRGETFTIPEYLDWKKEEEIRLKLEASSPKSKEQIKAEKLAAIEEMKELEKQAREMEKKMILNYKKQRLNPHYDPGVYIRIGKYLDPTLESWRIYENQWKAIDIPDATKEVVKGFIKLLITENAFQEMHLELRPIVDELMKAELVLLRNSLKKDLLLEGITKLPLTKKRQKPKNQEPPKPDKYPPEFMFQQLVDKGIIRKYPHKTLDDFWGDQNYAAADLRAIQWTPTFPPPCFGDVREQVRIQCLLTLGSSCPNAMRSQLLVGPKSSGKRTLIYAVATETNSILIDLSPMNVYNKFRGRSLKTMFQFINRVSRLMQPTVIFIEDADKMFYKKVPKEEKRFKPTRLSKYFFKLIIKPINNVEDKILILGTANEPWISKRAKMYKVFPNIIMLPRTDYETIYLILMKLLMKFHGVNRDFNLQSVAQTLRGYDIKSIINAVECLMTGERVAQLYYKPLDPAEIVSAVVDNEDAIYTDVTDYEMYKQWYLAYSPWGKNYTDYMLLLKSQLIYKLKADKKKKK